MRLQTSCAVNETMRQRFENSTSPRNLELWPFCPKIGISHVREYIPAEFEVSVRFYSGHPGTKAVRRHSVMLLLWGGPYEEMWRGSERSVSKKAIDWVNISGADTGPWQSDEQWAVAAVSEWVVCAVLIHSLSVVMWSAVKAAKWLSWPTQSRIHYCSVCMHHCLSVCPVSFIAAAAAAAIRLTSLSHLPLSHACLSGKGHCRL